MSTSTVASTTTATPAKRNSAPSYSPRTFLTLLWREVQSYFFSPIGYVVMFFALIAYGFNFYTGVSLLNKGNYEVTVVEAAFGLPFFWFSLILMFPLITMRTYADEFRAGTIETLTTAPVRDWEVVLAKFFGAVIFYCLLWAPSLAYFGAFEWISGKQAAIAAGAYWGAYLLLLLIGLCYISIGCLASALTTEQINAAVMSFVIIFGVFCLGFIGTITGVEDPQVRNLISYFSAVEHMRDFARGIIDTRPVVWYLSITSLVLVLNYQVFQYRKWKA